ncbi:hypothetical protein BDV3_001171 [Batrachochytrium dendrobatidis]|nr:hypothetical protein O5D80_000609 [Batrachochytrium dendrobatidis]KAK5672158.1 hypothetical protein QVD99_001965 [Batrachochytrium dendrobatidis]
MSKATAILLFLSSSTVLAQKAFTLDASSIASWVPEPTDIAPIPPNFPLSTTKPVPTRIPVPTSSRVLPPLTSSTPSTSLTFSTSLVSSATASVINAPSSNSAAVSARSVTGAITNFATLGSIAVFFLAVL